MTRQETITAALAGIGLMLRSIEAANNDDMAAAERHLEAVRGHFSTWLLAWNETNPGGGAAPDQRS